MGCKPGNMVFDAILMTIVVALTTQHRYLDPFVTKNYYVSQFSLPCAEIQEASLQTMSQHVEQRPETLTGRGG